MEYYLPQRYTLANHPAINESSFIIEQDFLRHIKTGVIPNLSEYLKQLNSDDWTCLLAENPREEFFKYLADEIKAEIDWEYVNDRQPSIQQNCLKKIA